MKRIINGLERNRKNKPAVSDEIAAMVAYIAGPESGFITGASLTIDGGFTS